MTYDDLLVEAEKNKLKVKEKNLNYGFKGLYKNGKIIIDKNINTDKEKCCILAEEIGHHFKTIGNIIDENKINNKKQELIARRWSYDKLIGIIGIINAFENNCKSLYEMAEFLNVTEEFLNEALEYYKVKYGSRYKIDNYVIFFIPRLQIFKEF